MDPVGIFTALIDGVVYAVSKVDPCKRAAMFRLKAERALREGNFAKYNRKIKRYENWKAKCRFQITKAIDKGVLE